MRNRLSILLLIALIAVSIPRNTWAAQQAKDIQVEKLMVQAMTKSFLGYHEDAIKIFLRALEVAPGSAEINAAIANEYRLAEDFSTAVYYASRAKDLLPKEPRYHHELARLMIEQDDIAGAETILADMVVQFPNHDEALEDLAYLHYSTGQFDKALDSYQRLEERLGPQQHISYRLLQIHYERSDIGGMEASLLALEKQDPTNAAIKRNLADLYAQQNRQEEALAVLQEAFAQDSSDVETVVALAQLYDQIGNSTQSDAFWSRAMQTSGSPEDAFLRATHLYNRDEDHEATLDVVIRLLEYAIEMDPSYTEALVLLGTIWFEEEQFESAGELLYQAVQINPRNPDVWLQAAAAYLRINQPKRAADIADEGLLLFPGQIPLLRVAAYGYMDAYENKQSIRRFEEFYNLVKSDIKQEREQSEILSALGLLFARIKDYPTSDSTYAMAIALSPDNAIVLNNLAYSLAEREIELEKALDYAKRAVAIESNNASFMDTLGWVYYKLSNLKKAEEWIGKAIQAGARSAVTYEHLGDIQVKLGKPEAALSSWNKSLELNPQNPLLMEKIKRNE